jgi:UDP-N-acetylglucosamine acyltransferase
VINDRAVIASGAQLGEGVSVGPYSIIDEHVVIGDGTWIGPHVVITGHTTIGRDNKFYQFSSIGEVPQHLAYPGVNTRLEIGSGNIVREYCTINRGSEEKEAVTRIGSNNFLMAYVHIAHDCQLGDNTIFANCASLAGHVTVGDYAVLGGFSLVHQYCRIGAHCITGIGSVCLQDVPPYIMVAGNRAVPHGVNVKGLRKRRFSDIDILELKQAYRLIYRRNLSLKASISQLETTKWQSLEVSKLAHFLKHTHRGIVR